VLLRRLVEHERARDLLGPRGLNGRRRVEVLRGVVLPVLGGIERRELADEGQQIVETLLEKEEMRDGDVLQEDATVDLDVGLRDAVAVVAGGGEIVLLDEAIERQLDDVLCTRDDLLVLLRQLLAERVRLLRTTESWGPRYAARSAESGR
jgi:hypothetical protein